MGQEIAKVTLRPLSGADEGEFLERVAVSTELHGSFMALPRTSEAFHAYVARYSQGTEESLLVCDAATGVAAGLVNLNSIIRGRFQNASLAYAAFVPYAGHGYLSAGVRLAIRYAFEELRLHRLDAQIQPANTASINLVRRLGFRHEGLLPDLLFIDGAWRDHELWAITNEMAGIAPSEPPPGLPRR